MAVVTGSAFRNRGIPISDAISSGSEYKVELLEGPGYLTLESKRDDNGFYTSSKYFASLSSSNMTSKVFGGYISSGVMGSSVSGSLSFFADKDIEENTIFVKVASPVSNIRVDFGGGEGFVGLLDTYSGAIAAYSLRDLASASVGSAVVRVRRSSDNTEQNFTATQIIDGTLVTFTGANDGFVTTWYDQSGNSNNAAQTAAANQPKLVSSGVVELDGGKPCLSYDTTGNDSLNFGTRLTDVRSVFQVWNKGNSSSQFMFFLGDVSSSDYHGTTNNILHSYYSSADVRNGANYVNSVLENFTTTLKPTTQTLISMISVSSTNNVSSIAKDRSNNGRSWKGKMQEAILYNIDQTSNRVAIDANIMSYYEYIGRVPFGEVSENGNLTLITPLGKVFETVEFASYGNPSGTNGNYTIGSCNASSSQTIVEGYLLGKTGSVTIPATNALFGDPCYGTGKKLAVKVTFG